MMNGLNFNRSLFTLFLSFVSLLVVGTASAQTSGQAKDEFSLFEEDLKDLPKKDTKPAAKKTQAPAATAKPSPAPSVTPTATASPAATPAVSAEPATAPVVSHSETADEKIERLKKEIRSSPKNVGLIGELAEELYKKEEYEKVTLLLWKHVDKIDRKGLVLLAKAHEKRKEPNEMIRALNVLIGKDEKDYEAYSLMGNAYVLARKTKDAMESYKKAVELNNKYEPAYDGLIALYEDREPPNLYELRILYQDMIDSIGPRPIYLRKLCEINTLDGTYEPAIQMCKDAIQKDPKIADPYVYLGVCYKGMGEDEKALKALKKASIDFPKSELAQYHYGKVLEEQKSYVDAMKVYKAGTEADPKAARSWLGLATSSFEIRKYELALLAFKNACKFDKKNAVAFRRATTVLRNAKNSQWIGKFEHESETCTF
nr:tetratricopeptide repeat protein [uncultured Bdellovibrio sp.]